eukprot:2403691-Amphidinium_carterae.1
MHKRNSSIRNETFPKQHFCLAAGDALLAEAHQESSQGVPSVLLTPPLGKYGGLRRKTTGWAW